MKTLQEKYIGVREGKFSKAQWLKEAKLTLPHLISPYNGFDDAVRILKNKSMIHEEVKADLKKTDKSVEDTNAKSFSYGETSAANVNFDQMLKGMQIEIEKDPEMSEEKAREKAIKNLVQDPYFYLKNQAFGIEGIGYTEDVPGLGAPKEPKGPHKASGYGSLNEEKLHENRSLDDEIGYIKYEVDFVPDTLEDYTKKYNGKDLERIKKALKYRKGHFDEMSDSKRASFMESRLRANIKTLIKEELLVESKAVSSRLKEIEADAQIFALERKIEAIDEEISERNHKISAVEEMDMKDMINPKKVKELQKEIKLLEKEKSKMEKMMEKLSKKGKKKVVTASDKDEDMVPDDKDMVDENSDEDFELEDRKQRYGINPEADEISDEDLDATSDYFNSLR